MQSYLALLQKVFDTGVITTDRTGVGTKRIFSYEMRFDLSQGFPLLTTKKLHTKSIVYELLWFLNGDTNIQYLNDHGVSIWNEWADEKGDLGPVYGKQWRRWETKEGSTIDQMSDLISRIKKDPTSRRLIISAWNVGEVNQMALPPCHCLFQFFVSENKLSCKLIQRSADVFLGVPFNIASYALLTHMIAQQCDLEVGEFIWSGGDCHLYLNHLDQAKMQLERTPGKLPTLHIKRKPNSLYDYQFDDFEFQNYIAQPTIKAPIAV
ncbi:MAG: thymidylate synthase [Gammaproteobacteria bacterium CG_4_10_14_0_8_um_filter_38_16]|nr:MAG: thymidylate synthase [Gammaproteobacteria bacterium CG_4_10_14_0_8_um_filter_38_16]PJA02583.1 MAG: thymidylate synthase [Gammaproteobacteria bacterium CG_4_10_14_0_2_um_filter_38_22]PJB09971.1 MAG: thymidylate synthase [Gammaproteobacteria bacterium CG_4_9_14_3_um_filter_38_9]